MFQDIQQLSDILSVRGFHIALLHHGVMKGGETEQCEIRTQEVYRIAVEYIGTS